MTILYGFGQTKNILQYFLLIFLNFLAVLLLMKIFSVSRKYLFDATFGHLDYN